ncbi:hypothetical protein ES705_19842 [subsurface metagenome]
MSKTEKQHEYLQRANRTIREQSIAIEAQKKHILTCVGIINRQKELIEKLQKPVRWWQVWK